jgi:predicted DNA-binding transcriptional regulator AlpA
MNERAATTAPADAPKPVLLPIDHVSASTGLSVATIKNMEGTGRFPRAVRVFDGKGKQRLLFAAHEVHEWIAARLAERNQD